MGPTESPALQPEPGVLVFFGGWWRERPTLPPRNHSKSKWPALPPASTHPVTGKGQEWARGREAGQASSQWKRKPGRGEVTYLPSCSRVARGTWAAARGSQSTGGAGPPGAPQLPSEAPRMKLMHLLLWGLERQKGRPPPPHRTPKLSGARSKVLSCFAQEAHRAAGTVRLQGVGGGGHRPHPGPRGRTQGPAGPTAQDVGEVEPGLA